MKTKKGPLHKRNGPKSRSFVFKPDPIVAAFYKRLKEAGEDDTLRSYKQHLKARSAT